MAAELEKPRVTEIQVRMDCNGCVQKIKKALHGVNGIYDLYIDIPNQKLTIVGWADPQKIVKAIRKTRKTAVICSHSEPPSDPPEQPPDGSSEESNQSNPLPQEAEGSPPPPPPEPSPPPPQPQAEPPKDPSPPPPENPQPEQKQSTPPPPPPEPQPNLSSQQPLQQQQPAGTNPPGQKDVGEVHVIYHHPPSDYRYPPPPDYRYRYGYGGGPSSSSSSTSGYHHHWDRYHDGPGYPPIIPPPPPPQPQPVYVAHHNYNTYRPAPYVTQYEYVRSTQPPPPSPPPPPLQQPRYMPPPLPPPQQSRYSHYGRMDYYNDEYHEGNNRGGNGNITSVFSDENPNACTVM